MTDEEVKQAIADLESRIHKDMAWSHVDCLQGWHRLVVECDKELKALDPNYIPVQIKQKFGGLRFYFDTQTDERTRLKMYEVTGRYEALSLKTCEETGTEGVLMKQGGTYFTINPKLAPEGSTRVDNNGI